jgi:hypothetical protein
MSVIRIPVAYASADDFCESNFVPIGPGGQVLRKMSPDEKEQLKARLHRQLPIAADGSIAYEAFANAVKGRVPNVRAIRGSGLHSMMHRDDASSWQKATA